MKILNDKGRYHLQRTMMDAEDLMFDEAAAIEAAQERSAVPHPRDLLKREQDRVLKGHPRDVALEKWGPELKELSAVKYEE